MVRRRDRPVSRPDKGPHAPNRRGDLGLMLGSLILGPIIGMAAEALLFQRAPGPVWAATVLWCGQVLVVWRYWRRPARPALTDIDGTPLFMIRIHIIAHMLALILPALAIWLLILR